jgi:ribosomal protein S18 acetylase RimI-like enzyme
VPGTDGSGPDTVGLPIRRVVEDDWTLLRDIRLEMLADSPVAYLETLADATERDEAHWRFLARRGSAGRDNIGLAVTGPTAPHGFLGYLACFVDAPGQGHVVSVYLTPAYRGSGVAARMLDAAVDWARGEAGLNRLHLYVHEHNARAQAFYRRYGFSETGGSFPYDLDPTTVEIEMAMLLATHDAG